MSSNRSILFIGAGIAGLVVLVTAVVLVAGDRAPQSFPPDSPQGVVQRYLAAWDADDVAAAYAYLSPRIQQSISLEKYRQAAADYRGYGQPPNRPPRGVSIDGVVEKNGRLTVQLTVEELYGEGLNTNVYRSSRTVELIAVGGSYRIDQPLIWLDYGPFEAPLK